MNSQPPMESGNHHQANSRKVLNKDVMKNLIGDDKAMIRKFEIEFLQQAKASLAKIAQLYSSGQLIEIKEEAHFLKTSAKAVGAEQVAYLLGSLEGSALTQSSGECKQAIVSINDALKNVYGAVKNES